MRTTLIIALLLLSNLFLRADSIPDIVKRTKAAIVEIVAMDEQGSATELGTGFFISPDGLVVTNFSFMAATINSDAAMSQQMNQRTYPRRSVAKTTRYATTRTPLLLEEDVAKLCCLFLLNGNRILQQRFMSEDLSLRAGF